MEMNYLFNMDVIEYVVYVTVKLKQNEGDYFMDYCYVDESYTKDYSPEIKDVPFDVIQCREQALIAGLANCMFLAEEAGHRKTHESLTEYIDKLKQHFSTSCIEIEKKDVNDI